MRGARFRASGMLGDGGKLSDGKLSVETKDATRLADLLPISWRATPALWQGAARLDVQAAGPHEALAFNMRLALADAQLEASPTLNLKSGEWGTTLALRHPGARRLLATLGLPQQEGLRGLPDWLGDGSLSLVAHLAGGRGRLVADKFDLTAATLHARGELAVDLSGAEPRVSGHVDTDAVTLPMPNGGSDVPLPLGVLHGWRGDVRLGIGQLAAGAGPALRDASVRADSGGRRAAARRFRGEAWFRDRVGQRRFRCRCQSSIARGAGRAERCRHHRPAGRCADRSAVGPCRCERAAHRERAQSVGPACDARWPRHR